MKTCSEVLDLIWDHTSQELHLTTKSNTLIKDQDIGLEHVHVHKGSKDSIMKTTHDEDLCTVYDSKKSQCSLGTNSHNPQGNLMYCLGSHKLPVWYTAQAKKNSEIIVQINK
jgi:hypothetical protein